MVLWQELFVLRRSGIENPAQLAEELPPADVAFFDKIIAYQALFAKDADGQTQCLSTFGHKVPSYRWF